MPDLKHSKPYKDFGRGFYLSADRKQAVGMGEQKLSQTKQGSVYVSTFLFDESIMTSGELKVKIFDDYSEEWVNFILANRSYERKQPVHDYDIVYGPIADDGVTFQLRRYEGGVISLETANRITLSKRNYFPIFLWYRTRVKILKTNLIWL